MDTYELVKKFGFDVSMMERLLKSGMPHRMLKTQNRMRPEFSALLKDIYPDLQDNLSRVGHNKPPKCLVKSMFFWSHDFIEDNLKRNEKGEPIEDRSKKNESEASMVMALALFLLRNGHKPSEVTILAGYLGQQKILRSLQREMQEKYPAMFVEDHVEGVKMQIQTIDMYQGDENDIVIVSLTRSNPEATIGFMRNRNRRCVAQSRAKCGMYFVGSLQTYTDAENGVSVWGYVLDKMSEADCVGEEIAVQCPKQHKEGVVKKVRSAEYLMHLVNTGELCSLPCGDLFPCGLQEHACNKHCRPLHRHDRCDVLVREVRNNCGHEGEKKCFEQFENIPCEIRVEHTFLKCGHTAMKKCHVHARSLKCQKPCPRKMDCQLHDCLRKCGDIHLAHNECTVKVDFTFSACGHQARKECYMPEASQKCLEMVVKTLPKCKHQVEVRCYEPLENIICPCPCEETMKCGVHKCPQECRATHSHDYCSEKVVKTLPKCRHTAVVSCHEPLDKITCKGPCEEIMKCKEHRCPMKCGDAHSHDYCMAKVKYAFPKCGHQSPMRKGCSEPISWKCRFKVKDKAPCGHYVEKECEQSFSEVFCQFRPCIKVRNCGHPCTNVCGDPCDKGDCVACEEFHKKKMEKFHHKAKTKEKKIKEEIRNAQHTFRRWELANDKDTKAEYLEVQDKVLKYIQDMHNWAPRITKIEKIMNLKLEASYERAKSDAFDDVEAYKFHGTSNEGVEGIIKEGFRYVGVPLHCTRTMYLQYHSSRYI